jgi:xylulokinase
VSEAAGLVLAVDCSTTAVKAVVVAADGGIAGAAAVPLPLSTPAPGHHEQDAEQWWAATLTASRKAIARLDDPGRVRAVCLTQQRESFVCLDAAGRPLRPAVLWLDARAGAEIAELGSDRVHAVSGKPPDTTPALYKLAWLARHEPGVLARTATVADVHGFLAERLTGRRASGSATADSLGLLDLAVGDWSAELLAMAGIRRDQVPDLVPPGAPIGPLLPGIAAAIGLPEPVPLIAGIGDGQAAGLGAGAVTPGSAYLNLGTSMVLGTPAAGYRTSRAFRTLAGAPAGTFVLETVLNAAAYLADWFRRELGDPALRGAPDAALEAAAAALPPGAEGLVAVPYWNAAQTPHWDPQARGALVGLTGRHTRAHVYRALLESVGFELRGQLAGLEAAGVAVTRLQVTGGGSRSPLWRQLLADITGRALQPAPGGDLSARGAAALGWAAVRQADVRRVAAELAPAPAGEPIEPRDELTRCYKPIFAIQQRLYPQLRQVFAELAELPALPLLA